MNCTTRVLPHFKDRADHTALWTVREGRSSFREVARLAAGSQEVVRGEGLQAGNAALVLAPPGPQLFSTIIGLLGLGITVVFVEPWLPVRDVEQVIGRVRPKAFIGSRLAQLWALRVPAVRRIPRWIHIGRVRRASGGRSFECADLDPGNPATITFSSGTTGEPKGLVRSHGCMWSLFDILAEGGRDDTYDAPDLCVFPNLALLQLGTGRGAVLVPPDWSRTSLRRVSILSAEAGPATMSSGPAFLLRLLRFIEGASGGFDTLRSIAVGGAQTDRWILERGFERWPKARWTHVYGGAEAEPVAKADARESVELSRARGSFQALYLGRPITALRTNPAPEGLWVSGPNVATHFADGGDEEGFVRRMDGEGREWHCMGDRIIADQEGWWYGGKASQPAAEFELEQRIYADLGTSACFVHRGADGRLLLYGDDLTGRTGGSEVELRKRYPELDGVRNARIVRDRRHRARIDRGATLVKVGYHA